MKNLMIPALIASLSAAACSSDPATNGPDGIGGDGGSGEAGGHGGSSAVDEDPLPLPNVGHALVIDVTATSPLADLTGVNKDSRFSSFGGATSYDLASAYQAFGVTSVRLHDVGLDLCEIYGDATLLDANQDPPQPVVGCTTPTNAGPPHGVWTINDPTAVDDASNYDFEATDAMCAALDAIDAELYLRLGESFNGPNDTDDPAAWAQVATNIYAHLIGQMAGTDAAIEPGFVEVFNEPDGMFWVGDNATFYELFRETVDGVRAVAAEAGREVRIGGAGFVHQVVDNLDQSGTLAGDFVAAVGPERLDFLSAHYYGNCETERLSDAAAWLAEIREHMAAQDLEDKPLHVTEWNIGLGQHCGNDLFGSQRMQSFVGGVMTLMQDPSLLIERAHFYAGVTVMALFAVDESANEMVLQPSAWAFWAHSQLADGEQVEALSCLDGDCGAALTRTDEPMALAARVADGYRVVLTNDNDSETSVRVQLRGLAQEPSSVSVLTPPEGATTVPLTFDGTAYVIADGAMDALVNQLSAAEPAVTYQGGVAEVTVLLPPHSVQLLSVDHPPM